MGPIFDSNTDTAVVSLSFQFLKIIILGIYLQNHLYFNQFLAKDKTEKRLIGFSFCPLMDRDGTVLPDGQHPLIVYKVEDPIRFKDPTVSYLQMPYSTKQIHAAVALAASATIAATPSSSSFQRSSRESVTVAFYLCSTKLTQNGIVFLFP